MTQTIKLALANWRTTLAGFIVATFTILYENPTALDSLIPAAVGKKIYGVVAILHLIILAMNAKDAASGTPLTVNSASPSAERLGLTSLTGQTGPTSPTGASAPQALLVGLLLPALALSGCAGAGASVDAFQNNPATQGVESALFTVGATLAGDPEFAFLAPVAVTGLTAAVNGVTGKPNPTAVTGDISSDASLVATTVAEAIPTSPGKTAATQIASAYKTLMTAPGITPNTSTANAALLTIANALTKGAQSATSAAGPHGPAGSSWPRNRFGRLETLSLSKGNTRNARKTILRYDCDGYFSPATGRDLQRRERPHFRP